MTSVITTWYITYNSKVTLLHETIQKKCLSIVNYQLVTDTLINKMKKIKVVLENFYIYH